MRLWISAVTLAWVLGVNGRLLSEDGAVTVTSDSGAASAARAA